MYILVERRRDNLYICIKLLYCIYLYYKHVNFFFFPSSAYLCGYSLSPINLTEIIFSTSRPKMTSTLRSHTYHHYISVRDEQIQTTTAATAWQSFLRGHRVAMAVGRTVLAAICCRPTRAQHFLTSLRLLSLPLRRRRTRFRALVTNALL